MKTQILALLCAAFALSLTGAATADDTPNISEVSEDVDGWLHAHCAYEGVFSTKDERTRLLDGEVAVLVTGLGEAGRLVKRFACKEKPAFYTEAFIPVTCEKLPEKERARCEKKFPPPPPTPSSAPVPAPAPPPATSAPTKPKTTRDASKPAAAKVMRVGF